MFRKKKNKPWWKKLKGKKKMFYPNGSLPGVDVSMIIPVFPMFFREDRSTPTEVIWFLVPTGNETIYGEFMHKIPYSEEFMWKKTSERGYRFRRVR